MKVICVGNSHVGALSMAAIADSKKGRTYRFDLHVGRLGHPEYQPVTDRAGRLNPVLVRDIVNARSGRASARIHFVSTGSDNASDRTVFVSMVGGNAHNLLGLVQPSRPFDFCLEESPDLPLASGADILPQGQVSAILDKAVQIEIAPVLKGLKATMGTEIWHLESPPPIRSNDHIIQHLEERFRQNGRMPTISPPAFRYKLWRLHSMAIRRLCDSLGIRFLPHPSAAVDEDGFLLPVHVPANATHAAESYGRLQLEQLDDLLAAPQAPRPPGDTPYRDLPDTAFWSRSVARLPADRVDPASISPFRISPKEKVATAGSCFAQHIARHLAQSGYNYHIAEQPHPALGQTLAGEFGYGIFSARYANIYTSRQLLQLVQRAEDRFTPLTDAWEAPDGHGVVDPFRPTIHPGGYFSVKEMRTDRDLHLAAVRQMLRGMDVFVFTLGLTETWVDRRDGAVFPLCPGVSGGRFDPAIHQFLNLSVDDVRNDLTEVLALLRAIRPGLKVILTVSPVPLKATASSDHVLTATSYSKSVLRVAAQDIAGSYDNVGYFPSYEIITGNFNRGAYYADDLREVRPEGVSHVMRVFFDQVTVGSGQSKLLAHQAQEAKTPSEQGLAAQLECEEELLEFDRVMAMRRGV